MAKGNDIDLENICLLYTSKLPHHMPAAFPLLSRAQWLQSPVRSVHAGCLPSVSYTHLTGPMLQFTFSDRYLSFHVLVTSANNSRKIREDTTEVLSNIDTDLCSLGLGFLFPFSDK